MNRKTLGILAGAAALLLACSPIVRAQGGRGMGMFGGGPLAGLRVLTTPEGEKELGLTTDQKAKVQELQENLQATQREKFQSLREELEGASPEEMREKFQAVQRELAAGVKKDLKEILKEDQLKRFEQINVQAMGFAAFTQPEIQEKLRFTEEQKTKLKTIQDDLAAAAQQAREENQGDFRAIGEAMQKAGDAAKEKALKLLTTEQKATWDELTGKPFRIPPPQFGGRRRID
jgi:hypothetical protein